MFWHCRTKHVFKTKYAEVVPLLWYGSTSAPGTFTYSLPQMDCHLVGSDLCNWSGNELNGGVSYQP